MDTLKAFLQGYREGVVTDYSTTKAVKLAKLQVIRDVEDFITPAKSEEYLKTL